MLIMYKVIVHKDMEREGFESYKIHEVFELYLPDASAVCSLIKQLSDYNLGFSLQEFDFAKCTVVDDIKEKFDLL